MFLILLGINVAGLGKDGFGFWQTLRCGKAAFVFWDPGRYESEKFNLVKTVTSVLVCD